eukprot:c19125_g1_i2 orf=1476-2048(+)
MNLDCYFWSCRGVPWTDGVNLSAINPKMNLTGGNYAGDRATGRRPSHGGLSVEAAMASALLGRTSLENMEAQQGTSKAARSGSEGNGESEGARELRERRMHETMELLRVQQSNTKVGMCWEMQEQQQQERTLELLCAQHSETKVGTCWEIQEQQQRERDWEELGSVQATAQERTGQSELPWPKLCYTNGI